MTRLANGYGEDFPEAAKRHYNDGVSLASVGRYDSAVYHFGFAIECSMKTAILVGGRTMALHKNFKVHDLTFLTGEVLRLATYAFGQAGLALQGLPSAFTLLESQSGSTGKWVDMRYRRAGIVNSADAAVVEGLAREALSRVLGQFYAHGDLP